MTKSMNRRDLMKTVAGAGLGFASVVRLQAQAPDNIPTWKRELRQLAPNVYAYMLATRVRTRFSFESRLARRQARIAR
jgi:hypothetical protein